MYVQDDVVIPPRHQVIVPARSTLDSLRVNNSDVWVVEPKQIRPGVLLARTLLPDGHRDIVVRVVNTTDEPQKLPRNLCLGESTQVEQLLDGLNSFTPKPDSDPDTPEKNEAKTKLLWLMNVNQWQTSLMHCPLSSLRMSGPKQLSC